MLIYIGRKWSEIYHPIQLSSKSFLFIALKSKLELQFQVTRLLVHAEVHTFKIEISGT
jgi:hypothetical protein